VAVLPRAAAATARPAVPTALDLVVWWLRPLPR
jgi:hypothetical protein